MRDERLKYLAANIKAERIRKNLKQDELAYLAKVSPRTISQIEQIKQTPSAFIVYDIANALGIPLDDLYKAVPKMNNNIS